MWHGHGTIALPLSSSSSTRTTHCFTSQLHDLTKLQAATRVPTKRERKHKDKTKKQSLQSKQMKEQLFAEKVKGDSARWVKDKGTHTDLALVVSLWHEDGLPGSQTMCFLPPLPLPSSLPPHPSPPLREVTYTCSIIVVVVNLVLPQEAHPKTKRIWDSCSDGSTWPLIIWKAGW